MFGGVGHSVLHGEKDEIAASKVLFDIFNIYRRL